MGMINSGLIWKNLAYMREKRLGEWKSWSFCLASLLQEKTGEDKTHDVVCDIRPPANWPKIKYQSSIFYFLISDFCLAE